MIDAFILTALSLTLVGFIAARLVYTSPIPTIGSKTFGLGNIGTYYADPVSFIQEATAKHGQIFEIKMLFSKTIWLSGTHWNKEYLEAREEVWSFGGGIGIFLNQIVAPEYWTHLKTLVASLSRGVTRADALQRSRNLTRAETIKALVVWQSQGSIEIFGAISKLVHGTIVNCLMGEDFYEHHVDELFHLLHEMEANLGTIWNVLLPLWVPHPAARRLWAARDRIRAIFQERLQARTQDPDRWAKAGDYISYTTNDPITKNLEYLYSDHHTIMLFAAHTSSVSLISWALVELCRSPKHLDGLRISLDECADPKESKYLEAVLKETIRHYCAMADVRLALQPKAIEKHPQSLLSMTNMKDFVSKIIVPPGRYVSVSPYLTHHDPASFASPEIWAPERWIENPMLHKRLNNENQIGFMPFGGGSHRCPGEKLAWMMAGTIVATIVLDYDLALKGDNLDFSTKNLDFSKVGSPWLKGGLQIAITRRSQR